MFTKIGFEAHEETNTVSDFRNNTGQFTKCGAIFMTRCLIERGIVQIDMIL